MGASGEAFLCQRGHLYDWIDDDLYWGGPGIDKDGNQIEISTGLREESRKAKVEGCPCGEKRVLVLEHYGDIDDCCLPEVVVKAGLRLEEIGEESFRVPIPDAVDAKGKPIKAYHYVKLPRYDVTIFPPALFQRYSDTK